RGGARQGGAQDDGHSTRDGGQGEGGHQREEVTPAILTPTRGWHARASSSPRRSWCLKASDSELGGTTSRDEPSVTQQKLEPDCSLPQFRAGARNHERRGVSGRCAANPFRLTRLHVERLWDLASSVPSERTISRRTHY